MVTVLEPPNWIEFVARPCQWSIRLRGKLDTVPADRRLVWTPFRMGTTNKFDRLAFNAEEDNGWKEESNMEFNGSHPNPVASRNISAWISFRAI